MSFKETIRSVTQGMPALITGGQPGYRAGDDKLAWANPDLSGNGELRITSNQFENNAPIPASYSADAGTISPPISWNGIPGQAKSIVLVVEDPDAPTPKPFVHWLAYDIEPDVRSFTEGINATEGLREGKNSNLKRGWTGMAPPKGDTPHRYFFQLFALDRKLGLEDNAGRTELFNAMAGHVIARGVLIGTYQRP
jgi:Raf kinase inhibitor-like YbhB/YbcL family protein